MWNGSIFTAVGSVHFGSVGGLFEMSIGNKTLDSTSGVVEMVKSAHKAALSMLYVEQA